MSKIVFKSMTPATYPDIDIWNNTVKGDYGIKNIHFIQDETLVDKLTFDVYPNCSRYSQIEVDTRNIIALYNGNLESTRPLYFIVIKVQKDYFTGIKKVTCASSMIVLSRTPYIFTETPVTDKRGNNDMSFNDVNYAYVFSKFTDAAFELSGSIPFIKPVFMQSSGTTKVSYTDDISRNYGTRTYAEALRLYCEKCGVVGYRLYTEVGTNNADRLYIKLKSIIKNNDPVEVYTSPNVLKKCIIDSDMTRYITHVAAYKPPKQTDINVNFYIYNSAYSRKRTTTAYMNNYMVVKGDEDLSLTSVINSADYASSSLSSANIELDPLIAENNVTLHPTDLIRFNFPSSSTFYGVNGYYIITSIDRCFDDPAKSVFKISK